MEIPVLTRTISNQKRLPLRNLISHVLLSGDGTTLLLDAGSLTSELAQVVKFGATYLTDLVNLDALDVRALNGEDTLHTNGTRHLTNSEALLLTVTADLDDYTTIELDTLL